MADVRRGVGPRAAKACCVEGCKRVAEHRRFFEITGEWMGLEAAQVDAWFCCEHLDMLASEGHKPPFLDIVAVGRVRNA